MKTLLFLVSLFVIGFCVPASAQPIDPDPDGMSIYFDTEGTIYCLEVDDWEPAAGAGPTVDAYLLVTRPDTPYPSIQAWVAHIEIETNSLAPYPAAVYLTPGMTDYHAGPDDYIVGNWFTLITGDATVIASIDLSWSGWEGHAEATLILEGVEDTIAFPDGPGFAAEAGFLSPCQPLFGAWGEVAWINGGCQTVGGL